MPEPALRSSTAEKALQLYDLLLYSSSSLSETKLMEELQCNRSTLVKLLGMIEVRRGLELQSETRDGQTWHQLAAPARRPRIVCQTKDFDKIEALVQSQEMDDEERRHLLSQLRRMRLLFQEETDVVCSAIEPPAKAWVDLGGRAGLLAKLVSMIDQRAICQVTWKRAGSERQWLMAPTGLYAAQDTLYVTGWHIPDSALEEAPETPFSAIEACKLCCAAVHRLTGIAETGRVHQLPMTAGLPRHFGTLAGEPFRVRARFEAAVADYVQDRHYSDDERKISYSDGTLELEFTARSQTEVVSWLLGFGSSAMALEPASLVARLKEELAAILARYGGLAVYEAKVLLPARGRGGRKR